MRSYRVDCYTYILMTGKLIACLLLWVFLCYACQEIDEDFVFELVRKHYPDCQEKKPHVVHVREVRMVDGTKTKGLYLPKLDMILLSDDADLAVLVHEYRHACGDLLGEKIILSELAIR